MSDKTKQPNFSNVGTDGPIAEAFAEIRDTFAAQTAHFDRRLNELGDGLKRLNNAIGGDAVMGQDGVITRLTSLEKTQAAHADKFKLLHAMWWIGGSVCGGVLAAIVWIVEKFHFAPK